MYHNAIGMNRWSDITMISKWYHSDITLWYHKWYHFDIIKRYCKISHVISLWYQKEAIKKYHMWYHFDITQSLSKVCLGGWGRPRHNLGGGGRRIIWWQLPRDRFFRRVSWWCPRPCFGSILAPILVPFGVDLPYFSNAFFWYRFLMEFLLIFHNFLDFQNHVFYCKTNSLDNFRLSGKIFKIQRF